MGSDVTILEKISTTERKQFVKVAAVSLSVFSKLYVGTSVVSRSESAKVENNR